MCDSMRNHGLCRRIQGSITRVVGKREDDIIEEGLQWNPKETHEQMACIVLVDEEWGRLVQNKASPEVTVTEHS